MAYAFSLSATTTEIEVKVTGITSSYRYIQVAYRKSSASSNKYTDYEYASGSSITITIDGLSPDTEYTVNVRYSADGASTGTFIGSKTITTDPEEEEELLEPYISDYTIDGTSIILEFDDLDDCPYISVLYRKTTDSSANETGYTRLTSRSNTIELPDLDLGSSYVISFRYSTDGDTLEGTASYGTIEMPEPEVPYISSYSVSGNSIILYFANLSDYPYINVIYRTTTASSAESTGYKRLTSSNNSITLSGLEYGETYAISFRYGTSSTSQAGVSSYGQISIDELDVPSATGTVSGNSIILTFSNYSDCPYISVLYRPTSASSPEETGYKKISSSSRTITLSGLQYGETYAVSFRYSVDSITQEGTVSLGTFYITPFATDAELVAGCKAYWYNYANGNRDRWYEHTATVCVKMGEDYDFDSAYFIEAGVIWRDVFNNPSTSLDTEQVKNTTVATEERRDVVVITYKWSELSPMATANHMVYLKTINGTYMPIPAAKPSTSNSYQFAVGILPEKVDFTDGYVPEQGQEVKLKATDIVTFIKTMNYMYRWFYDSESCGVDLDLVNSGGAIYAETYSGLYDALNSINSLMYFTMPYVNTYLQRGKSIRAEDMLNLRESINNLIGVLK